MTRQVAQLIREGGYAAEVIVDLREDGGEWSPVIGPEDVRKLDRVRRALRDGDFEQAEQEARVFELVPRRSEHTAAGFGESKQGEFKP